MDDTRANPLDLPEVNRVLFHPRRQYGPPPGGAEDLLFPAYDGTPLGARFHPADPRGVHVLYFHGNGEIAEDYDDVAPVWNQMGMSLVAADFRGYGASGGRPSVSSLLQDALAVYNEARRFLADRGRTGPLWVMGRSLGSAPALEIAENGGPGLAGLVIESGFSRTLPLLEVLGLDPSSLGLSPGADPVGNLDKMSRVQVPCLVIHAENDPIIPFAQGQELFEACPAAHKRFFPVPRAGHNDILLRAGLAYFQTIRDFAAGKQVAE
ncbi:MAG: lysophospholipase [Proteobacteria bacterium]|nr:lysophospholipase [Pseudomonadota bacterium]